MKPDFWLERWEQNRIGFHQPEVNELLRAHWADLGVAPPVEVFVPLCGKSRDMLWLRERGHSILGVELARIAVRDFFAENHLTPKISAQPPFERWEAQGITLLGGDFFDLTAADVARAGAVYDRASLIALPKEMRGRYVDKLADILPPGIEMLLVTLDYPEGEIEGPPFSVTETEVRALYAERFRVERLAAQEALGANTLLQARGLSRLTEQAYRIRRSPAA